MNFLDILILIGLAWAVIRGYRKGVVVSLFKLLGYLAGLATGYIFSEVLAKILDRSFGLTKAMMPWLVKTVTLPASTSNVNIADIQFEKAQELIDNLPLPNNFKDMFMQYINELAQFPAAHGINKLGEALVYIISNFLLSAICFMVVYVLVSHVIAVTIPKWIKKVSPAPVKFTDHLGGAVLGLAGGLISLAITVAMLLPVAAAGALEGNTKATFIGKVAFLFNNSVIVDKLSKLVIGLVS